MPVPGGPVKRMEEKSLSVSIARRSSLPGAMISSCPTNSSRLLGRRRAARGASDCIRSFRAWSKRSMRRRLYSAAPQLMSLRALPKNIGRMPLALRRLFRRSNPASGMVFTDCRVGLVSASPPRKKTKFWEGAEYGRGVSVGSDGLPLNTEKELLCGGVTFISQRSSQVGCRGRCCPGRVPSWWYRCPGRWVRSYPPAGSRSHPRGRSL